MSRRFLLLALCALAFGAAVPVSAAAAPILLINSDFEAGTLAGWTTFTTSGGTLGPAPLPAIEVFDVDGDASSSHAAKFQVGVISESGEQGGGIFQGFTSLAGVLSVTIDIASFDSTAGSNSSGGVFSLLIDGVVVDVFDFGLSVPLGVERATLSALVAVASGAHEVRILMTRPFGTGGLGNTPFQYIDDVALDLSQSEVVPEPSTLLLLSAGLAALRRGRARNQLDA